MTRKDFKLSEASRGLPENFDLWEELEDKNGEKISGGEIFRFVNNTNHDITVTIPNNGTAITDFRIRQFGTQILNFPRNQINVELNNNNDDNLNIQPPRRAMNFSQRAIFDPIDVRQIQFSVV